MVSLKDIANECGVSIATVSKALNGHKDIGKATKERIQLVAKEMGYHPNSAAQALKTNRTNNIGVLFVDDNQSGLTHDFFSHVLDSFKKKAEENGYDITFINCSKTRKNTMSYLEHCRYRGFDGVVIACVDFEFPEVYELINSNIPVVTIDHMFSNRIVVVSDNVKGMRDLFKYIYDRGHRRIAFIHGTDSAVTRARLSSFYKAAEDYGVEIPDEYIREAQYRATKASYEITKEFLELEEPPTCILYPDDFASLGGISAIAEKGLKIPEDISIVGYDGLRLGRHLTPRLTSFKQDTDKIGSKAAEALISLIEKPKSTIIQPINVAGELYEGESVGYVTQ